MPAISMGCKNAVECIGFLKALSFPNMAGVQKTQYTVMAN